MGSLCPHRSWITKEIEHLGLTYVFFSRDHGYPLKMPKDRSMWLFECARPNHVLPSERTFSRCPKTSMHLDSTPWLGVPCQNSQLKQEGWGEK